LINSKFDLTGRTAIITGGNGILGQGFCKVLAEYGANVAIFDNDKKNLNVTLEKLRDEVSEATVLAVNCDLRDKVSIMNSVNLVAKRFGRIDILHNNAATKTESLESFFKPFEEYSLETWREVMSVNIDAMFLMAQAVGKTMLEDKKGGSIIQTASIYGMVGADSRIYEGSEYLGTTINTPAAYATSKAAVLGLTKYLATYWGNTGIRVNSLTPGGVKSGQNDAFNQLYSAKVPMRRMAELDEMGSALLFLASDAASYITGQNIVVDGGFTSW
jgi:NAD(P)-dependent dehydrogenase (short-subunit alcohol dehydrogenase family)